MLLGLSFTCVQAYEYSHAAFHFTGGIYPSTFFMATGFHGFHVIIGTTFLAVCLWRAQRGDFTPTHHFGLEAAAWYWHFVDVVWLFLFVCIYWWGMGAALPFGRVAGARVSGEWTFAPVSLAHAALKCRCPRCGEGPRLHRPA